MQRGRWRPRQRVVYVKQDTTTPDIEALAAKMAEQMVAKILDKLPASTTTIIQSGRSALGAAQDDGQAAIAIDDTVLASASSDITGIERVASLQETKTTQDSTLQASKDKLARLKKG